jgi:hypothetical protein
VTAPPLTHHEILAIVAPFARRGRHVDLAATDRAARRIVFTSHATTAEPEPGDAPEETLALECRERGSFLLERTLAHPDGRRATLQALGTDPGLLLAEIESVPRERHFESGPGYTIQRSYTVNGVGGGMAMSLALSEGSLRVGDVTLALRVPPVRGVAGEITLEGAPGTMLALPEDLLAVLGWNWSRLARGATVWTSRLRLRGGATERTRAAERALEQAGAHLARTLAEPPSRYHERLLLARWGVFFRRGIPTWNALALVVIALATSRFQAALSVPVWLALYHVPTLLVAASFLLQEQARFEIPPWPRRLRATSWWHETSRPMRPAPRTANRTARAPQ